MTTVRQSTPVAAMQSTELSPTSLKHEIRADPLSQLTRSETIECEQSPTSGTNIQRTEQAQGPIVERLLSCNCRKTQCLKLYCECFAYKTRCGPLCKCESCLNNQENDERRLAAMQAVELRDGSVSDAQPTDNVALRKLKSNKGCSCKKSGCLKKYCECYSLNRKCNEHCVCQGCRNPSEHCLRPARTQLLQSQPPTRKRFKHHRFLSSEEVESQLNQHLLQLPEQHQSNFLRFLLLVLQQ